MKLFGSFHAKDSEYQEEDALDMEFPEDGPELDEDGYEGWDEDAGDYEDGYEDPESPRGIVGFFQGLSSTKVGLLSALLTVVVLLGAGALVVNYFLSLINYQAADSEYFNTVSNVEDLQPEPSPVSSLVAQLEEEDAQDRLEATPEELAQWDEHIEDVISDSETYQVPIDQDVYNILLVGTDVRDPDEVGRSDAMILVSINQKSQTIYLTSFLRDCYIHIPGYGNTRLNHAFAYGGPALLEETLEENFKIHVDRYVMVNFYSFMDVVDTLGGVWIYITEEEREVTNDYIWSMNKLLDEDWSNDYIWSDGWHKLNGKQSLCYARNRYVGNDYQRTQRQRNVLTQIFRGCKAATPATLVSLAQVVLPQVTTDMTKTQVLNYAANFAAYMDYEIVSQQIPAADTYYGATIGGMSVISLDLDANINYLQSTIYEGASAQSASDYGEEETEWDAEAWYAFWSREEWSHIDWDKVDWSTVDWDNIDYDTVDWTDYYYPEETTSPSPGRTTGSTVSPSPSPGRTTGTTVSPSPSPSPTPKLNEGDEGT